jgi:aminoglycoside N3'-acetyltransferase
MPESDSRAPRREIGHTALVEQLSALGVFSGDVLLVHTSFRAVQPVADGPRGLISALRAALGPDGTLVMPSWTGNDQEPFDPARTVASRDLGVVADTFWRLPGVQRSNHPFAFAAAGRHAAHVVHDPLPLPPHIPESPAGRVHELDGKILLLGVDHEVNTTLHLAELLAGVPYRVPKEVTVLERGRPVRLSYGENDHCTKRFALMGDWLDERRLQSAGTIGHAAALLARSRDAVNTALERLARDPLVFLHDSAAGCAECNAARASLG